MTSLTARFFLVIKHVVLFSAFYVFNANTQQPLIQVKNVDFELNGFAGFADYSYFTKDNSVVYEGPFYFNYSANDSLNIGVINGLELSGSYKNGLKSGSWIFSQKELQEETESIAVRDPIYSIQKAASGSDFLVHGNFDNGLAQGSWSLGDFKVNHGVISDTLFFAQGNFEENQLIGSFSSGDAVFKLVGSLNKNGFLNGVWSIVHLNDKSEEFRYYEEGLLVKHMIKKDGRELFLDHVGLDNTYAPESEEWDTLDLNKDYLKILLFSQALSGESDKATNNLVERSNEFLMSSLILFNETRGYNIWSNTSGSKALNGAKIKVHRYPFSNEEKVQIDGANNELQQCEHIINEYLLNPQVNISKYANQKVAYYYAAFTIYRNELSKLRRLLDVLSSSSAEYVDKSAFIPHAFRGTSFPDEVIYQYNDEQQSQSISFPTSLSRLDANVKSISEHINLLYEDILQKEKIISPIILENKKRAEIADKEELLVSKKDSIINLFGNFYNLTAFNEFHERYSEIVINTVDKSFTDYARQPIEVRIDRIEGQLACFDDFLTFYKFLSALPEKLKEIESLYTRTVWNPFTFTDMDEIVKDKVYNAYNKIILPYLFHDLEETISCSTLSGRFLNFKIVFDKMKTLRNQDTQELEGKLKKQTDVQAVLSAFELKLELN